MRLETVEIEASFFGSHPQSSSAGSDQYPLHSILNITRMRWRKRKVKLRITSDPEGFSRYLIEKRERELRLRTSRSFSLDRHFKRARKPDKTGLQKFSGSVSHNQKDRNVRGL